MRVAFACAVVLLSLGCKGRSGATSVNEAVGEDRPPEVPGYVFVGCRPNAGECYNSCADHKYLPQSGGSAYCEARLTPDGPYECHCLVGDGTSDGAGDGQPPEY